MLLTGCAGVRRIVIEPSNGNGTAGWSLDTVSVQVAGGDPVEKGGVEMNAAVIVDAEKTGGQVHFRQERAFTKGKAPDVDNA